MATWAEFAKHDPELAAFGLERIVGRIVYQATLRLDGSPRVHFSSTDRGDPRDESRAGSSL